VLRIHAANYHFCCVTHGADHDVCIPPGGSVFRFKPENLKLVDPVSYVFFGIGCDGCGLYPVVGGALTLMLTVIPSLNLCPFVGSCFRCKDCPEATYFDKLLTLSLTLTLTLKLANIGCFKAIGFDLCQDCVGRKGKMGRFNQQHTPDHKLEETIPNFDFLTP